MKAVDMRIRRIICEENDRSTQGWRVMVQGLLVQACLRADLDHLEEEDLYKEYKSRVGEL